MSTQIVSLGKVYGQGSRAKISAGMFLWQFSYTRWQTIPIHQHQTPYVSFCFAGDIIESNGRAEHCYSRYPATYTPRGYKHSAVVGPTGAQVLAFELQADYFTDILQQNTLPCKPVVFNQRCVLNQLNRMLMLLKNAGLNTEIGFLTHEILTQLLPAGRDNDITWLNRVKDYLHAHFADNPSPNDIARQASRHPTHLMRAFRQMTGMTLGQYLRVIKVNEACRLIRQEAETLTQIALRCGFSDQSHFIRVFKAEIGVAPGIYRQLIN